MEERVLDWLKGKDKGLNVTINIYHHTKGEDLIVEKLDRILAVVRDGQRKEEIAMATLQEQVDRIVAKVTEENTLINSLAKLTGEIKALLVKALAGELSAEAQAKFDEAFAVIDDNIADVTAAITANTDEVPPPPPPPIE